MADATSAHNLTCDVATFFLHGKGQPHRKDHAAQIL